jgi:hypothetical protein
VADGRLAHAGIVHDGLRVQRKRQLARSVHFAFFCVGLPKLSDSGCSVQTNNPL